MSKKKVTYAITEEVLNEFKALAEINALNMSKWIENQMIKYIEKQVL